MKLNRASLIGMAVAAMLYITGGALSIAAQAEDKRVPEGTRVNVMGMITQREPDSFTMISLDAKDRYVVNILPDTSVKTNTKGLGFRGGKRYETSYLLRGLRLEVEGRGNAEGAIQAEDIRFNETDLRSAQMLEVRMDPVEQQVLANKANIAANTERISVTEQNQQRMAGQVAENTALANRAQGSADAAQATADRANNRINGLDEFENIKTIVVPFAVGKAAIGPQGRQIIDEAAAWVKTQNTKGWMVAVVGFADSTGNSAANKVLSEKRSNAVIGYLVSKYNLPLTRLIQPFGAGADQPVATNDTAEGRSQNRRVEIRLLLNKGIADK